MRFLTLFVILFVGWLLMSGHYNGLLIGLGVASCALCAWLSLRIGATDSEGLPIHLFSRLPSYLTWLIGEIVSSNIATAKIILRGTADPETFEVPANQATSAGLANYANSITLTPGTVTVDIEEAKTGKAGSWFMRCTHNLGMMCAVVIWIDEIVILKVWVQWSQDQNNFRVNQQNLLRKK